VKEVVGKKRRKQGNAEEDLGEKTIKKEKLENQVSNKVIVPGKELPTVPELVFVNGKVQVAVNNSQQIEHGETKKLEIVNPGKKKVTTSNSFKKSVHTEKWTEKETIKFYRVKFCLKNEAKSF